MLAPAPILFPFLRQDPARLARLSLHHINLLQGPVATRQHDAVERERERARERERERESERERERERERDKEW